MTEENKTISNDDDFLNYKFDNTNNPFKEALKYFLNHPSITNIKSKSFDANFTFRDTNSSEAIKIINPLNVKRGFSKEQGWMQRF